MKVLALLTVPRVVPAKANAVPAGFSTFVACHCTLLVTVMVLAFVAPVSAASQSSALSICTSHLTGAEPWLTVNDGAAMCAYDD